MASFSRVAQASEQHPPHALPPSRLALRSFDPAPSDIIHQIVSKHKMCVCGRQSHNLQAMFHQIVNVLPNE